MYGIRVAVVGLVISSLFMTMGCSAFKPSTQPVTISASNPQAMIYVDGEPKGTGTITADLKRNRSHAIMAKVGQRTGVSQIDKNIATTGVLDIVGTFIFLVPVIGIFSPGFYDLDRTHVDVVVP